MHAQHTGTRKEIVRNLEGVSNQFQVDRGLSALLSEGRIRKLARGTYCLAGNADGG